jgi:hypothetical protein
VQDAQAQIEIEQVWTANEAAQLTAINAAYAAQISREIGVKGGGQILTLSWQCRKCYIDLKCSDDLTKSRREMSVEKPKQIRIQILAAKEEAGTAARAVAVAQEHMADIADIARRQEAEALLVCPAPEEISEEGVNLVVYARFAQALDEDTVLLAPAEPL